MTIGGRKVDGSGPWIGAVVGGFLLVAALLLAWAGFSMRGLENSVPSWNAVPGTLLKAGIVYDDVPKRNTPREWQPDLRYRYLVAGTSYEGTKLVWGDGSSGDREKIEKDMMRVLGLSYADPLPRAVTVHYSPLNPQVAVLEPSDRRRTSNGAFAVAGLVGWFGLMILVMARKQAKSGRLSENKATS